jgi:hypothetical protein
MTEATTIAIGQETHVQEAEGGARSLSSDAWRQLKKNPIFWVSVVLITLFLVMAAVPQLFTSTDPTEAVLRDARMRPNAEAWFGRDIQGYDIYGWPCRSIDRWSISPADGCDTGRSRSTCPRTPEKSSRPGPPRLDATRKSSPPHSPVCCRGP